MHHVLSYAGGGDLFFRLQQQCYLDEPSARVLFAEVVSALRYLHARGVIYRDLKPDNILVGLDGHILLADFGVSKQLSSTVCARARASSAGGTSATGGGGAPSDESSGEVFSLLAETSTPAASSQTMVGTPMYMAPEVLLGRPYGLAADWWSAGIVLHEILAGETPFAEMT